MSRHTFIFSCFHACPNLPLYFFSSFQKFLIYLYLFSHFHKSFIVAIFSHIHVSFNTCFFPFPQVSYFTLNFSHFHKCLILPLVFLISRSVLSYPYFPSISTGSRHFHKCHSTLISINYENSTLCPFLFPLLYLSFSRFVHYLTLNSHCFQHKTPHCFVTGRVPSRK